MSDLLRQMMAKQQADKAHWDEMERGQDEHKDRMFAAAMEHKKENEERSAHRWRKLAQEAVHENEVLKEALARAEGLARTSYLQSEGLFKTIAHLRKAWGTEEGRSTMADGNKLGALVDKFIDDANVDPGLIEKAEALIDENVRPNGKPPKTPRPR